MIILFNNHIFLFTNYCIILNIYIDYNAYIIETKLTVNDGEKHERNACIRNLVRPYRNSLTQNAHIISIGNLTSSFAFSLAEKDGHVGGKSLKIGYTLPLAS